MDIRQLEILLAIAEQGSFSGAARELHTVQSNISTHVAHLEAEVKATLVDRNTGNLTPEGVAIAERARRIQGEIDAIGPDLAAMRDEVTGTVKLGMIGTVGVWLLAPLLNRLDQEFPLVKLQATGATTTSLGPRVAEGSLHVAVVNLPTDDTNLTAEPLFEEARILAVHRTDPLAKRDEISLDELAEVCVMVAPAGTAFRDEIDESLHHHGISLAPRAEVDSMELLASVVASGTANALLPASAVTTISDIVAVPVPGLVPRLVGLVSNRLVPPSATTLAIVPLIRDLVETETQNLPGLSPTGSPNPSDHVADSQP